ncbi:permease for cytosine/purines, uracil, thiamine, allantoin-domain-containing protein [Hygrophoropsis aurantiaca]|uniref:Permease for cytosine/purines, uracil, thiamine, allantoin-domain-containing protein n=1 Tax=Hygrophoropsis aurantiaca TaxID=72124 RepID=A0ACB8AEN4_9AGAM|nr:permease for cytosine/purines, uracil, thiamine, allantoin-domain-containing protein [Hygrophoropsis aurantiaca]
MPPEASLHQTMTQDEKSGGSVEGQSDMLEVDKVKSGGWLQRLTVILARWGIETHGIAPIPAKARTDTRWYQMFFVWFSSNMNIYYRTSGPAFFGLGARDTIVIVLVVDAIISALPAIFAVFGPKLGTRAMVQCRFSWGYYGSIIPSVLNVISLQGFLILNCIIGGQTLASVSSHLDDTLGIIVISLISLVLTFCGYRIVHWYESVAWIPNAIAFIAMIAVGYPQLRDNHTVTVPPPSPASVLSYISLVASTILSWCTMTPDYGVYHSPNASSARIFFYTYLAFFTANITSHTLGAAFAAAATNVPSWNTGFDNSSNVGGLVSAILGPIGGFGKFLTVLVALSIPSACAPTMYSFGTSFMAVHSRFASVPRWIYVLISEGILIPVAIIGARKFYTTFVDVINVIGYWSAVFISIILVEHIFFRRASFTEDAYPITAWSTPSLLPNAIPAIVAFLCGCAVLIPCMSQAFYVGPIARMGTGDIGVLAGFFVSGVVYAVVRGLEKLRKWVRISQKIGFDA